MSISSHIDKTNDLTVFTSEDNSSVDEFMAAISSFYAKGPTKNVLWNLTRASVWDISGIHIEKMAYFAPRFDKRRKGAKTAIVASDDLSSALSKLFVLFGESRNLPIAVRLFNTTDQAMEWLLPDDSKG